MDPSDNIPLAMTRDSLDGVGEFPLPEDFQVRPFQSGDEKQWVRIHELADRFNAISPATFTKQFGTGTSELSQRQYYLVRCGAGSGEVIGTASAWYGDEQWGRDWGRVHWVAIMPQYQGRGLAKPLLATVMQRLAELGHRRAYLTTSTARLPAIRLYQRFGFVGHPRNPLEQTFWDGFKGVE